jgi:uncharacterized protein with HEPN domain
VSDSPQREWRFYVDDMIGFAEKVLAYLGIDNDTLWSIVRGDIPALLPALRALKIRSV